MASPKKSGSTKVYQTIWNHIDQNLTERLKEWVSERGNNTIERIRWELFDVLTLWGDEKSRKEVWKNIKAELEKKLSKKEEAIKEKRKSWDVPSNREENEIIILKKLIKDVDYRLGHGIPTPDVNDLNRNIYLDLDKNNEFDKDIVKNVVDDIIDSDMDNLKNNILLKRLIESDKYYEEICKEIRKYWKKLYKGLFVEDILDYLKSVKEKNSNSLEKKLLDFKVNGWNALRLREKNDIRQRFNSLEPWDRILLNDWTTIIVISKSKYWNKITFREDRGDYWTQERTENFNEFSGYRCKLWDIKEIIIGLKLPETESKTEPEPEPKSQPKTEPEPKPKPQPKIEPEENVVFEENAVLSDVSESYEDMISREVENEINDEWHNTARYNVFKRGKLFLMRWKMRKDRIAKKKENYQRTPFTNNGTFNREMAKQAARHDLEENLWWRRNAFWNINRENLSLSKEAQKEFKEMCQEYVAEKISQVEFQNRFNQFVQNRLGLPEEQQFVATNILEKLDAIKNDNKLLKSITSELEKYLSDHNNSHFDNIRTQIDNDFKNYRRDPRFRKAILEILWNTAWLTKEQLDEKINKFIKHQKALAKASANNLQIKLDLLTNGKWAYQTNNKDRENWLFRFGNKLDKMPRWWQALTVAWISASWMLVGWAAAALGASAFVAGLAGTATLSGLVWAKNFIKKWTHHTKEQNTYEKNLTRNYEEEIAKMKEWERIRTEKDSEGKYTHWRFARYRAKRQLELYGKTTQAELQDETSWNTKEIVNIIYGLLERYDTLSPAEKNALNCNLLDAKARLETYRAKWHNFLKSKDKNQIERDFYDLENALALSADRILGTWATINDIPLIQAYDGWKEVNYQELLEFYKKDYNSATKKFSWERARLATKWWLGTAAVTFGTSAAAQAITGTWMFAKEEVLPTTTWKSWWNDHFALWHENLPISSSTTYSDTTTALTGLPKWSTVDFYYWVGTDAVPASAGSYTNAAVSSKISTLSSHISSMSGLSWAQKSSLLSELSSLSYSWYNSDNLAIMRATEKLEHIAEAMNSVWDHSTILNLHRTLDVSGTTYNKAAERFMKWVIKITTPGVEWWNKWLVVGLPWFSNTFKRKNDGKPKDKWPNDKGPKVTPPKKGWDDQWKDKWKDHSPEDDKPKKTWPKPVDPKKNPDDVHKDDEPKPEDVWKKVWEVKWIVTRWQKINAIDDSDLWVEYPGEGKMLTPIQAATNLIICHWEDREHKLSAERLEKLRENKFSPEDIKALNSISDRNEQIAYLTKRIEEDRSRVEKTEEQRAFDMMKEEIAQKLPKHLKDIFWEDYKYLNTPMSMDRVHLVSDRDFLAVDCNSKDWVLWVFRSKDWDIYMSHSFLERYGWIDWSILYSEPAGDGISTITYPEVYFHIIHTLVHEMIHSMSAINYFDTKKEWNKSDYFPRRVGLKRIKIKNSKLSTVDWWWFNEGATESLAWEILSRWHRPYKNPELKVYMTYKNYINIIEQMEKTDGITKLDFWKAMLIRKRDENPDEVEKNTPLYELLKKINWKDRPEYYDIIMNAMDGKIDKRGNIIKIDTDHIIEFIKTKDIQNLKDWLPSGRKLSDVFDKKLLKNDSSDFKQEILDTYKRE